MVSKNFLVVFLTVTAVFSFMAYEPADVVIAGPQLTDLRYFEEELKDIEYNTGLKIKYEIYSDIETYLIENQNTGIDIAIILNPQGVVNLGEKEIVKSIDKFFNEEKMRNYYSAHLQEITTSRNTNKNYGAFFRLFPNSMIWYSIEKFKKIGSPEFKSYEDMLNYTNNYSEKAKNLWCLDIESGASTGWIATNWLEDLILSEYGVEVYDGWSNQDIVSSNDEILNSINNDGAGMGLDLNLINLIPESFTKPIIISGGTGNYKHIIDGLKNSRISAVSSSNLLINSR